MLSIDSRGGRLSETEKTLHQAIRGHLVIISSVIAVGVMTVYMSLFQPTPSVFAQQLTKPVFQEIGGAGTQGRRGESPKPHRLIRKPQSAPVASVEPSPSSPSP